MAEGAGEGAECNSCRGEDPEGSVVVMNAPFMLALMGLACSLAMSCRSPDVYVTTGSGAPISGAVIEPAYVSFGCMRPLYTDTCGRASLPGGTPDGALYHVRKPGYRTASGLVRTGGQPNHVVLAVGRSE